MGHADLWKEILDLIILHEDTLSFQWVPLHVDIHGNEEADALRKRADCSTRTTLVLSRAQDYGLV